MFRQVALILCFALVALFVIPQNSSPVKAANQEKSVYQFHSWTTSIASGFSSSPGFSHLGSLGQPCPVGRSTSTYFSMMAGYWPIYISAISPVDIPEKYKTELHQNYPNPFNPMTEISFSLSHPSEISLRVFDMRGRMIRTILSSALPEGNHTAIWDGKDDSGRQVSSGPYFCRLVADKYQHVIKVMLVK